MVIRREKERGIVKRITVYVAPRAWQEIIATKQKYGVSWGELLWYGAWAIENAQEKVVEYALKRKGLI